MGAWGVHWFENDGALDWFGEFCDDPGLERANQTLVAIVGNDDATACEEAIAAAEITAIASGHPSVHADVPDWIADRLNTVPLMPVPKDLPGIALIAVDLLCKSSELKDLWDYENDENTRKWYEAMDDLRTRLQAAAEHRLD